MKTQDIERVIANKIADHWYKEIHGQTAPIFGKQKLRDFVEAELKKMRIPHVSKSALLDEWNNGYCRGCEDTAAAYENNM